VRGGLPAAVVEVVRGYSRSHAAAGPSGSMAITLLPKATALLCDASSAQVVLAQFMPAAAVEEVRAACASMHQQQRKHQHQQQQQRRDCPHVGDSSASAAALAALSVAIAHLQRCGVAQEVMAGVHVSALTGGGATNRCGTGTLGSATAVTVLCCTCRRMQHPPTTALLPWMLLKGPAPSVFSQS
jgi:hypothetical protein